MEARKQCVYNQTRGRFLGLDVDAGDFSVANLNDRIPALTPKSGAGLWIVPFRGISAASMRTPLDLVYLDGNCEVIEVVESFPIYRVSVSIKPAASVLALPTCTIDSTETRTGDHLVLCAPEEMKWFLKGRSSPSAAETIAKTAAPLHEGAARSGAPNLLQWEDRSQPEPPIADCSLSRQSRGNVLAESKTKSLKPARSWLERFLSPDPPDLRKSPRESLPGLAAHFWTGGAPEEHCIRDISPTGLYVVTDERWYPGTVVRMTLTDSTEPSVERSITVNATAVRWGNDGVGLHLVAQNATDKRRGLPPVVEGVDKKQLERFMDRIRSGAD